MDTVQHVACQQCGVALPAGARYCWDCGHPVAPAQQDEQTRKTATLTAALGLLSAAEEAGSAVVPGAPAGPQTGTPGVPGAPAGPQVGAPLVPGVPAGIQAGSLFHQPAEGASRRRLGRKHLRRAPQERPILAS